MKYLKVIIGLVALYIGYDIYTSYGSVSTKEFRNYREEFRDEIDSLKINQDSLKINQDSIMENQVVLIHNQDQLKNGQIVIYDEVKKDKKKDSKKSFLSKLKDFF